MRVYVFVLYGGCGKAHEIEELDVNQGHYVIYGDRFPIYLADVEDIIQPQKGDIFATLEIEGPKDLVDKLIVQGSDEQFYSDGYEAWDDIRARAKQVRLLAVESYGPEE